MKSRRGFQDSREDGQKYIYTYMGRRVTPLNPKPEQIDANDISHALSMKCRYTGHCREFYSVAEHCVLMARCAGRRWGVDEAIWALLHDAAEAYLPDISRPLKSAYLFDGFDDAEETLMRTIIHALHLPWPTETTRRRVKGLDTKILVTETDELMPDRDGWDLPSTGLHDIDLQLWSPREAEIEFFDEYSFLTGLLHGGE